MGSLRVRPTRRARLRSGTTASSGMRHIASSCTSYTLVSCPDPFRKNREGVWQHRAVGAGPAGPAAAGPIFCQLKGVFAWDAYFHSGMPIFIVKMGTRVPVFT